jgi:hypothetical protein
MSSPTTAPLLDLDQVATTLTGLRPGWVAQGLTAGPLTWRDASASWPRPLLTNRSTVLEPESVGITLTAADGREGRLVIWRGGWADVDVLADGTVTSRNPAIHDVAECIDLASSLVSQLIPASTAKTQRCPNQTHDDGTMADDFNPNARWTIQLWSADAVVLPDWLTGVEFDQIPVHHKAQKQALTDLLTALEAQVPVVGATQAQIDQAQIEVSKDMGWQ